MEFILNIYEFRIVHAIVKRHRSNIKLLDKDY